MAAGWPSDPLPRRARQWRPDPLVRKAYPVDARTRGHIERPAIRIAEGHVRGKLGRLDRAEVLPLGGDEPDATRSRDEEVTLPIDLHAVEGLFAGCLRHVEEAATIRQLAALRPDLVAHHHLALLVPVRDVQEALVGRERDPVRSGEIRRHELQLAVVQAEHAAERELLARIVEGLRQPEWRVREVKGAV